MTFRTARLARALALLAWMALIFYMSGQPDSGDRSGWLLRLLLGPLADSLTAEQFAALHLAARKGAHFTEFAILALLWVWNVGSSLPGVALAGVLSGIYAGLDEIHQAFVPGRVASAGDAGVDALGIIAMLLIIRLGVRIGRGKSG